MLYCSIDNRQQICKSLLSAERSTITGCEIMADRIEKPMYDTIAVSEWVHGFV